MRHPNLPHRKIRHASLLTKAGFVIDMGWMNLNNSAKSTRPDPNSNVAKLIYWKHPTLKMTVCIHDYEQITLANLVERVYAQAQYWTKRNAFIAYKNE